MILSTWQMIAVCFFFFSAGLGVLLILGWALWIIDKLKTDHDFLKEEKTSQDGHL